MNVNILNIQANQLYGPLTVQVLTQQPFTIIFTSVVLPFISYSSDKNLSNGVSGEY